MRKVHFFFNSKGGVGKSHNAAILGQFYEDQGEPILIFDADATSATLSNFHALKVTRVPLMSGDAIDARQFDHMLEPIITEDTNAIVDTGASSFVEINRYFMRNPIPAMIREAGKVLVANLIIVGGSMFTETCNNLDVIAEQMPPEVEIVVWLNPHFGSIENGKAFEDMEIYRTHKERVCGVVRLPDWTRTDHATFGVDVEQMMKAGLTFNEVRTSPDFNLIAKSRLNRIKNDIYGKLTNVI
jgi:hypothetical protein